MKNDFDSIEHLVRAVEEARVDIAPSYQEYMQMAFAIANSCGEAGRPYFHRLCSFSLKYHCEDADKIYDQALRKGNLQSSLGTVYHLATCAGVSLKPIPHPPVGEYGGHTEDCQDCQNAKDAKDAKDAVHQNLTHARVLYIQPDKTDDAVHNDAVHNEANNDANNGVHNGATEEDGGNSDENEEDLYHSSHPLHPLPCFHDYAWPPTIQSILDAGGRNPWQRDVLFLAACVVLGICLSPIVYVLYAKRRIYPCLQFFVVAPPASGKGVMEYLRYFADPFHKELRQQSHREFEHYQKEMAKFNSLGKQKSEMDIPVKPQNKMFLIPANNSGTGILQNLIESDGRGLILETEAEVITQSLNADYGKWGDLLRSAFDQSALAYNRRGNGGEYRESDQIQLGVAISGTPGQFIELVQDTEKGGFSRQLYYYMQPPLTWENPLAEPDVDLQSVFQQLGKDWKKKVDKVKKLGNFKLQFTSSQADKFNAALEKLMRKSMAGCGEEMVPSVKRLGVNTGRIMEVVAMCRMMDEMTPDDYLNPRRLPHASPSSKVAEENRKDGLVSCWDLSITEEDFQAVLNLLDPLYDHIVHMLSLLPEKTIKRRNIQEKDKLFNSLPREFTFAQYLEKAREWNVKQATAKSWLNRTLKELNVIVKVERGFYRFCDE